MLRIDREPGRLAATMRDVLRKVQLATPNHQLGLDWPVDDLLVSADQRRIYQVVQNLLTNAVKYSPHGGTITLSARVDDKEAERRKIIFDPIPRVDGIDTSGDPISEVRSEIYLLSGRRRRAAAGK